jgi:tetratricopeptide (TPR) repeat protein
MTMWADLIERGDEMAALAGLVNNLARGSPASMAIVVEGPAGIGKTRLLDGARKEAQQQGVHVLSARGSPLEQEITFGVTRQLFEPLLLAASPGEQEILLAGAARPAAALFGGPSGGDLQSQGEFPFLRGLFLLAARFCENRPTMLLVDDLQWADPPSLRFLLYLMSRLEDLPLGLLGALRSRDPQAQQHLLELLTSYDSCRVLCPTALSHAGVSQLLKELMVQAPEEPFVDACHRVSSGNPLMLKELAEELLEKGVPPHADGVPSVEEIGPRALSQRVKSRLATLRPEASEFVMAAAVLGDEFNSENATALTDLSEHEASHAISELERAGIFQPARYINPAKRSVAFQHPLERAVIEESLEPQDRYALHGRAVKLLTEHGADPEQIAAHILKGPPGAGPEEARTLRDAAQGALARGSPEAACTYLRRCLDEPETGEERRKLLIQLGTAYQLVDFTDAANYLSQALVLTDDTCESARIAWTLGTVLVLVGREGEALDTLSRAITNLPENEAELRKLLESSIVTLGMIVGKHDLSEHVALLRSASLDSSVGAKALDCAIAIYDAYQGVPSAISRARRALADHALIQEVGTQILTAGGWHVLACGDQQDDMVIIDAAVHQAQEHGWLATLAPACTFRGLARMWWGDLAGAADDLREAVRATEIGQLHFGRVFTGPFLADVLMEQGHLDDALSALEWIGTSDEAPLSRFSFLFLISKARLLRLQGHTDRAAETALAAGNEFAKHWGQNPAYVPWRSEVALCLDVLGDTKQACSLAQEELSLARKWQAPRALGHALRIAGLVHVETDDALNLLHEAVEILGHSPARLEHAKALVDLGAVLLSSGHRTKASAYLNSGLNLARRCNAPPIAHKADALLLS